MAIVDEITAAYAEKFDAQREVYYPPGATVKFLIIDDETNDFETIYELSESWYFEYSKDRSGSPVFRGDSDIFKLSVARGRDEEIVDTINRARYVEVVREIYVIRTADTLAPQGEEPVWKLYCEQHSSQNQFSADV
jgi:hypothetical protein